MSLRQPLSGYLSQSTALSTLERRQEFGFRPHPGIDDGEKVFLFPVDYELFMFVGPLQVTGTVGSLQPKMLLWNLSTFRPMNVESSAHFT